MFDLDAEENLSRLAPLIGLYIFISNLIEAEANLQWFIQALSVDENWNFLSRCESNKSSNTYRILKTENCASENNQSIV